MNKYDFIENMASQIIVEAKLKTMDPVRQHSRSILAELRKAFGIDIVRDPTWREFLAYRDPEKNSNKYHYFVVFQDDKDQKFHAANAYGRIGYKPKVHELGIYDKKEQAISAAKTKMNTKMKKGYEPTKLY